MDPKYIEPLVRRAVQEKFPESLYSLFEIMKRIPIGGLPSMIPGIGENLNDAIRQLIYDNIFTIKGTAMDAISELDVIQKLADNLEQSKKDFVELVFPLDNRNVYGLFCKLVSYCISMKYAIALRKCARIVKSTDLMHPLKVELVNWIRADFCQIAQINLKDLAELPRLSKEMAVLFVSTLCMAPSVPDELSLVAMIADWLANDPDLMSMVRPQTSSLICWCLTVQCQGQLGETVTWKLHLAILNSFQQRSMRGKKHAFLSGTDVKSWIECTKGKDNPPATDMILQLIQVALHTQSLHVTKDELDWFQENLQETEFTGVLVKARAFDVS